MWCTALPSACSSWSPGSFGWSCSCGHEDWCLRFAVQNLCKAAGTSAVMPCSILHQSAIHPFWVHLWAWHRLPLLLGLIPVQVWLGQCLESAVAVRRQRCYTMVLPALAAV